jgi:hypothetical protein
VGNPSHIPKRYIFEVLAHSANFFGFSQGIEDFQEIFDIFYTKLDPIVTENKSAKSFNLIAVTTMGYKYEFLTKFF